MAGLQRIMVPDVVRRMLNWKQGDEEDTWRNKAVETLIKKLKRQPNEQFAKLHRVLLEKNENTPCITLPKSQDGRLQVSHKKMLPHLMYCRIFRWPDLQSHHELKSVPSCAYPALQRETDKICINPYHYTRVDHSVYPPVVTPRTNEYANISPPSVSPLSTLSTASDHHGNYLTRSTGHPIYQQQQSPPPGFIAQNNVDVIMSVDNQNNVSPDDGQDHWCKITYAELNHKIGEPFKGSSPKVIVDGYTNPPERNRRFSLGVHHNTSRNSTIETTRRAILGGVCLENWDDTQIFVENLSEKSIFFHSKNFNFESQSKQHAVVKVESKKRHKIFDQRVFKDLVDKAIDLRDGRTYERLFSLIEHCIIKMSFVKGWGANYQRQDVTSTPCWIEIHLLKPYALIDECLRQVGHPSSQITSTS